MARIFPVIPSFLFSCNDDACGDKQQATSNKQQATSNKQQATKDVRSPRGYCQLWRTGEVVFSEESYGCLEFSVTG